MTTPVTAPRPAQMPPQVPQFRTSKTRYGTAIDINDWSIRADKRPILNGKEIDAAEKRLGLPLPEMTFGNNHLTLSYRPGSSSRTGFSGEPSSSDPTAGQAGPSGGADGGALTISWNAVDALAECGVGEGWEERVGGGVQVSMAEQWSKPRAAPSLLSEAPLPTVPVKPHDWTYSTTFAGSVAGPSKFAPSDTHELPLKLLARQDPILDQILFYDDVPLFEDELHDNGESILNVRIRVMPHSFFILSRLFLRVDNVLFRIHDVRIYHAFGSGEVIRESRGMEATYDDVKSRLEKPDDLSPLADPNFVYAVLSSRPEETHADGRPKLDHRPSHLKKGKAWPGLGRKVEVLNLQGGLDGLTGRLDGLEVNKK